MTTWAQEYDWEQALLRAHRAGIALAGGDDTLGPDDVRWQARQWCTEFIPHVALTGPYADAYVSGYVLAVGWEKLLGHIPAVVRAADPAGCDAVAVAPGGGTLWGIPVLGMDAATVLLVLAASGEAALAEAKTYYREDRGQGVPLTYRNWVTQQFQAARPVDTSAPLWLSGDAAAEVRFSG